MYLIYNKIFFFKYRSLGNHIKERQTAINNGFNKQLASLLGSLKDFKKLFKYTFTDVNHQGPQSMIFIKKQGVKDLV